ncbi:MAG: hypothetical protein F4X97_06565 [Boseongicola sp. SB0662_bin_57]|nr:hypothetical protein [Boseongicola sp. SB0662_bin_57]
MPEAGERRDGRLRIDMAALHPALQPDGTGRYHGDCQRLRDAIKVQLREAMEIEHELYLTANATAGLMVAVAGLALDGIKLNLDGARYPGYAPLRRHGAGLQVPGTATFLTHVDPLSGRVTEPAGISGLSVVDASQSFGTVCRHAEAFRADVVISGLHKHAGIAAGVGVLAIGKDADCAGLRRAAAAAERGTVALPVLEGALARCSGHRPKLFNRLVLSVRDDLIRQLADRGLEVLTPAGANLPFVCLKGELPKDVGVRCASAGFSAKLFPEEGVMRMSGHAPGRSDSPMLDRSDSLADLLMSLTQEDVCDAG